MQRSVLHIRLQGKTAGLAAAPGVLEEMVRPSSTLGAEADGTRSGAVSMAPGKTWLVVLGLVYSIVAVVV